jgi:NTE family protein
LGGRTITRFVWGINLGALVAVLRAAGSRVETIAPASDAEHMFGANAMDVSLRGAAARAGYEQGSGMAERIRGLWDWP